MKHCSACDLEYPDASGFCKVCGGKLEAATAPAAQAPAAQAPCPACGAAVQSGWGFCKQCGEVLEEVTLVSPRAPSSEPVQPEDVFGVTAAAPAPPHAFDAEPAPHDRRRGVRRGVMVAALVLCVAVFAAGVAAAGWYMAGVSVAVQTDPAGSGVIIDGMEVGRTDEHGAISSPRLRAGEHTLSVAHDGYDTWRQDFNIALTDFGKSLNVKLKPIKYRLTVTSSPPDSEVLVDNSPAGRTSDDDGTLQTEPLLPGAHTVVVRADGYRDWKQSVDLKGDAHLDVRLSAAPAPVEDTSSSEGEVRTALSGWAQSIQNRDIEAHMRYYADTLDYYYARIAVPSSRVRDDRSKAFVKFNWLSVQVSNVNLQMDSTGQRATAVFDKTFDFRGEGGNFFSGSVQNQLTMTKLGGAWLITGEKELKVYDVKSSPGQ